MVTIRVERTILGRRGCLAAALAVLALPYGPARADERPVLRLGELKFGSVQWLVDVIRRHQLDQAHGFTLETAPLANNDAGRVALMAQSADVVVSDWFFVANQRGAGTALSFAPFSSTLGALMVPAASPVREFKDLRGRRLGVAGGPVDKSWLLFQAASRATADLDVAAVAQVTYGAPPLLQAKLQQGELDAVLTFWNFAARLEADGFRQVMSVADCARGLQLPLPLSLVGFVFHESWARQKPALIEGFLAAADDAQRILSTSDADWQAIRPLMDAPDDALFASLRRRYVEGIAHPAPADQQRTSEKLFDIILHTGGTRATGDLEKLPEGVFWQTS